MARKTAPSTALEDFEALNLVRYEIAKETYDLQDDETRGGIDKIVRVLKQYASDELAGEKLSTEMLDQYLLFLAVEMVKDLAMVNVRLYNFVFPPTCVKCGDPVG